MIKGRRKIEIVLGGSRGNSGNAGYLSPRANFRLSAVFATAMSTMYCNMIFDGSDGKLLTVWSIDRPYPDRLLDPPGLADRH